jgi:hypothetical protein
VHVSRLAALARSSRTGAKGGSCSLPPGDYDTRALGYDCPLFARKFPKMTAATIHGLLSRCSHTPLSHARQMLTSRHAGFKSFTDP